MKKAFYMMAAAAIALSSCSSEETTDVAKSSAITFRTTVGLNSRGLEMTSKNIQEMWVSAFYQSNSESRFDEQLFSRESGSNVFVDPTNTLVWEAGRTYQFVAISPQASEWSATSHSITKEETTFTGVTPKDAINEQKDLLFGTHGGASDLDATNGAALNLDHVLSQLRIKVYNKNPNLIYTIRGIRIKAVNKSGNYSSKTGWAGQNNVGYYELKFDPVTLDGTDATPVDLIEKCCGENHGAMLVPQSFKCWDGKKITTEAPYNDGGYISLLLNVRDKKDVYTYPAGATDPRQCGWVAVPFPTDSETSENATWKMGNKYVYSLNLSTGCGKVDPVEPEEDPSKPIVKPGEGGNPGKGDNIFGALIKFTVTVTPWKDRNNVESGKPGYDDNVDINMSKQ